MFTRGWNLVSAELFQMRHRTGTWVLLAIWAAMAIFFGYIFPYFIDSEELSVPVATGQFGQPQLLPDQLVANLVGGFPFYGGAIALMLGVLTVGSEFGWGTLKTLFTQRPGRGEVFAAKMTALAITLIPFVVIVFALSAVASVLVAMQEGQSIAWPSVIDIASGMLAGWVILLVWAAVGVALAVLTRGTSLAIGIGIIYALVIEGLVSSFANRISSMEPVIDLLLRANAYSLVQPLVNSRVTQDGPGGFSGPYVSTLQALIVLGGYIVICSGLSAWLLHRRDVA